MSESLLSKYKLQYEGDKYESALNRELNRFLRQLSIWGKIKITLRRKK